MIKHKFRQALAIVLAGLSFSGSANVGFNFTGQLNASSPTYNRVSDRTSAGVYLDSANNALPYTVIEIRTPSGGGTVTATVNNTTEFDSFLSLYSSFNPANPTANILAADDDSAGYPHASLTRTGLAANTSYFLVITSYSGSANSAYPLYGNYALTINGAGLATYAITTTASPLAGGSVSCSPNPVLYGGTSSCTATPSSGYTFSTFSGDCAGATCILSNVTAAKSVTANYTALTIPGAPAVLSITPGPGHLTITLQPPSNTGGGAIVGYSATCTTSGHPSVTATSATTTVVVPGLVPGVSYACTATASNGSYSSAASTVASAIPKPMVDLTPILMLLLD
jgi:hypothetical protein